MELAKSDCALAGRDERITSYVAGTLPDREAEAFEVHYFACDQCWRELQQGLEIRAAAGLTRGTTAKVSPFAPAPAVRQVPWRWIAAAASVVLVASVWRWSVNPAVPAPAPTSAPLVETPSPAPSVAVTPPAPAAPPVRTVTPGRVSTPDQARNQADRTLRSPSQREFRPTTAREANGDIRVEWKAIEKAARYVLRVFSPDGSLIFVREDVSAPPVTIDAASLSRRPAGERQFAVVDAIDALGVKLASSARIELPRRP